MVLGFDFGMKYIGVATGQTITKTASPLTSLRATDGIPNWDEVQTLIDTWSPTSLIVGIPDQTNNSTQLIINCIRKFANRLQQKYKLPVILVHEHLTTWEAKQQLLSRSTKLDFNQLSAINAQAAAIILQQWLQDQ